LVIPPLVPMYGGTYVPCRGCIQSMDPWIMDPGTLERVPRHILGVQNDAFGPSRTPSQTPRTLSQTPWTPQNDLLRVSFGGPGFVLGSPRPQNDPLGSVLGSIRGSQKVASGVLGLFWGPRDLVWSSRDLFWSYENSFGSAENSL
jgi:hypothetical protein